MFINAFVSLYNKIRQLHISMVSITLATNEPHCAAGVDITRSSAVN